MTITKRTHTLGILILFALAYVVVVYFVVPNLQFEQTYASEGVTNTDISLPDTAIENEGFLTGKALEILQRMDIRGDIEHQNIAQTTLGHWFALNEVVVGVYQDPNTPIFLLSAKGELVWRGDIENPVDGVTIALDAKSGEIILLSTGYAELNVELEKSATPILASEMQPPKLFEVLPEQGAEK